MNSEPQLFSDPLPANIQAAIASTSASIATLEPVYGAGGKLDSFRLLYANPSFLQLACDSHEQLDFERTAFLPALLKLPNIRSRLNEVWRSNTSKLSTINYQKREKSFVLQLSVAPVEGLLVITLVDITSLSHTHEMLELQTTLMEENTRSLEAVRSALEAEIGRRGRLENKLRKLASTDHLSGLANRRAFMERAAAEYRRSLRYSLTPSI